MTIEAPAQSGQWRTGGPSGVEVRGKFFFVNGEKFYVRGVTYGAFRPDSKGREYTNLETINRDFAEMAANGINCVRIPHTMPPPSLLDLAGAHGLRVMVGLSGEQYVGYLADGRSGPDVEAIVREKVAVCAGHPALLCYAIGNEIPASITRWLGPRRVERYLQKLYQAIKAEDSCGIVTYVNYPTTEYLQLPFLDVVSFNVYLETQQPFEAYIARLQNIAGDRPLLLTELGLDSLRNGEEGQAASLDWQIRSSFTGGCAGAIVFAWTDEWHRADAEVDDWRFGLTDRERKPKPALATVAQAFAEAPFSNNVTWPRISVVVCSYNGARTIRDTFAALQNCVYPDFEVILVDDGSTDVTAAIGREFGARVISTPNRGLSNARNTGYEAATGEIVAYIDDDAYPDPHWLHYLADRFVHSDWAAVGGPNLAPSSDGPIAEAVAASPGGPVHVLISDTIAEHIPGCNMAFRKSALQRVGGFDPRFRTAGDDVDLCWRLQEAGEPIGFSPAAVVWHHRRNSIRTYWRQQVGYGRAEALLERKWPEKYNVPGHVGWRGRIYNGLASLTARGGRIYHGVWGSADYQSLYQPADGLLSSLVSMPEWYLAVLALGALSALGLLWPPLLLFLPLFTLGLVIPITRAVKATGRAGPTPRPRSRLESLRLRALIACLHALQPVARLWGRLTGGLAPWRRRGKSRFTIPRNRTASIWTEQSSEARQRLACVENELRLAAAAVTRGGPHDSWDLHVRGGMLGSARALMAVEEHGGNNQLVRWRCWPVFSLAGALAVACLAALSAAAALDGAITAAVILGASAASTACLAVWDAGRATAAALRAFRDANKRRGAAT